VTAIRFDYGWWISSPFHIFIVEHLSKHVAQTALTAMKNTTVKSFLLLWPNEVKGSEWDLLKATMVDFNENYMFYMAYPRKNGPMEWKLVLSVKNQRQVVTNDLKFLGTLLALQLDNW